LGCRKETIKRLGCAEHGLKGGRGRGRGGRVVTESLGRQRARKSAYQWVFTDAKMKGREGRGENSALSSGERRNNRKLTSITVIDRSVRTSEGYTLLVVLLRGQPESKRIEVGKTTAGNQEWRDGERSEIKTRRRRKERIRS